MIIKHLTNYPPWYYKGMHNPGDTRIELRDVNDTQKDELEQLMDAIFVRNEILPSDLRLSHEPESTVKCWIRQLPLGHYFFNEPGLKKVRRDYPAGGYLITYESGRSGNPYEKIAEILPCSYRASMQVGPLGEELCRAPAGGVDIFVHLHRENYGDILIREVIKKFNPDFSEELKERKRIKGRYERRSMLED